MTLPATRKWVLYCMAILRLSRPGSPSGAHLRSQFSWSFRTFPVSPFVRLRYTALPMCHFKSPVLLLMSAVFAISCVAQNADTPKPKQAVATASVSQSPATPKSKEPVATIGDQTIYDTDLASSAEGQLQSLRTQEFQIKRKALDHVVAGVLDLPSDFLLD